MPDLCDPRTLKPRYAMAGLWAAGIALVLLFGISWLMVRFDELPTTVMLWLGMLPVQVGAFAAALIVLHRTCAEDRFLAALELEPCGVSPTVVVRTSGRTLVLLYPAAAALAVLCSFILSLTGYRPAGSPLIGMLMTEDNPWFWLSMAVGSLALAPVAEEVLFRVIMYESLHEHCGAQGSAVLTSMAFAAVHRVPEQFASLFVLGLVLQKLRRRHGNLWLPIATHAGFNALGLLLVLLARIVARVAR